MTKASVLSSTEFPRQATLLRLLTQLEKFSTSHFDFFDKGFTPPVKLAIPTGQEGVSAQYVFGTIIDQLAHDISIFERIEAQRRTAQVAATLRIADLVAYHALGHVSHLLKKKEEEEEASTVLTYLQKAPDVRVIPYAPVALIGIPRTCHPLRPVTTPVGTVQGLARDLLAIPHELGHHLYWNGVQSDSDGEPLRLYRGGDAEPAQQPVWFLRWLEEIFADVLTCVIGGPLAALGMQELQLQARNDWLLVDNGVHPVPAFRTYIYIAALAAMHMNNTATQLRKRWQQKLTARQLVLPDCDPLHYLSFAPSTAEAPVTFQAALDHIVPFVQALVDLFRDNNLREPWSIDLPSDTELTDEEVERIYREFEAWVESTFGSEQQGSNQQIDAVLDTEWPLKEWDQLVAKRGVDFEIVQLIKTDKRPLPQAVNALIQQILVGEQPVAEPLPYAEWIKIVEFAGWSTEGPTDGNLSGG
ncbi:MAG: hypothetical protein ACOYNY_03705 [Caldilineaceae bacterium]